MKKKMPVSNCFNEKCNMLTTTKQPSSASSTSSSNCSQPKPDINFSCSYPKKQTNSFLTNMNQTVHVCLSGASRAITQQLLQFLLAALFFLFKVRMWGLYIISVQSEDIHWIKNWNQNWQYNMNEPLMSLYWQALIWFEIRDSKWWGAWDFLKDFQFWFWPFYI